MSQTPQLKSLTVHQSDGLAALVLSPLVATFAFRHLRSLELGSEFSAINDPFDPQLYIALPLYPSLRHFAIRTRRTAGTIDSVPPKSPSAFASLEHIELTGALSQSSSTSALVSSASRVSTLHLVELERGQTSSYHFLSALPHPERLKDLEYTSWDPPSMVPSLPTVPISRFTNLVRFCLSIEAHVGDPAFFDDLAKLRSLRTLEFSNRTTVDLSALSAIVDVVKLDTLYVCVKEPAMNSLDWPWFFRMLSADAPRQPVRLHEASWRPDFAREEFQKFAAKCESKEIKLLGNAIESLQVEDEFRSGETERQRLVQLEELEKDEADQEEEEGEEGEADEEARTHQ
ncbi:hypothetical protein JCM3766R1_006859 [Sporobolomyces carnicolor]